MAQPELTEEIYRAFRYQNHRWRIDGELKQPTKADISDALDHLRNQLAPLDPDGEPWYIEGAGLIMVREQGHYDVYVRFGELDD